MLSIERVVHSSSLMRRARCMSPGTADSLIAPDLPAMWGADDRTVPRGRYENVTSGKNHAFPHQTLCNTHPHPPETAFLQGVTAFSTFHLACSLEKNQRLLMMRRSIRTW